jgi:predicted phage replisome organizer
VSEITWIKLKTDMFDNQKIRLIEALPEGDTILVIWIKLLTYAGKTNANGFILINEDIALSVEEIAIVFSRPLNVVRLALEAFKRYGMITLHEDVIRIKNWDSHQNVEGMERAKQLNAERNRKYRERKKLELPPAIASNDVSVTSRDAIDKELDLELDLELENNNHHSSQENEKSENPILFYEQNGFGAITPYVGQKVHAWIDDLSESLIIHAMKISIENGVLKWNYVESILKGWANKKFKTVEEVQAFEMQRKQQQQPFRKSVKEEKVPDWVAKQKADRAANSVVEDTVSPEYEEEKRKLLEKLGVTE